MSEVDSGPPPGEETAQPAAASHEAKVGAWLPAIGVTLVAAAALGYAFQPEQAGHVRMLMILGGAYGLLLVGACVWLGRRGQLAAKMAPRRGDITFGALLAVGTYMVATLAHLAISGRGSPREPWMMRIYLQIGDPQAAAVFVVGLSVLAIAAAEEVVWRGWVMGSLAQRLTARRAWLLSTALYAVAHLPTVYLLRDPLAGPNPLLVLAALGGGLVWGYLAMRVDRLGPSMVGHALLAWAVVEYPLWRM